MNEKQLIEKYYKTNNVVHFSEGKYSKTYTKWLERQVLKLSKSK